MCAFKPCTGDITQHAGKTTTAPEVRRRLRLDLRPTTTLPLAAPLS
jgi:hypothetical protein